MVRIEENKLVIELDNGTLAPLEHLQYLRRGIINALECVGLAERKSSIESNATFYLCALLRDMELDETQSGCINASLSNDKSAMQRFNRVKS